LPHCSTNARLSAPARLASVHAQVERGTRELMANAAKATQGQTAQGKSTLVRMLAGFETPSEGRILLDGEDIVAVPPHRRPVNMMFQSYALFPHLNVEGNIAFGLSQETAGKREIAERVAEML